MAYLFDIEQKQDFLTRPIHYLQNSEESDMIFQNPNGDKTFLVGKNSVDKDDHIPGEPNIIYEKQNDG